MDNKKLMKASVYKGDKIFEIEEKEIPTPGPNEVLVKIKSVGICGSDMLGYLGKTQNRKPGLIFGHEASGVVAGFGENVVNWSVGDRVALFPSISCGECEYCRRGIRNMCNNSKTLGSCRKVFKHGAMCEYMIMPANNHLFKLPDNVSFDEGAFADPLGNCLHVMNRAEVKPGDVVAVIGTGSIGLIAIQTAKLSGAKQVIAVDTIDSRLELAKNLGATEVINALNENTVDSIKRLTDGKGADVVMNAAGNDISYKNAVFAARKRGAIAAFGYSDPDGCLPIPSEAFLFKELRLLGNAGMNEFEIQTMLDFVSKGLIRVDPIITHRFSLDKVTDAFELIANNPRDAVKVMINTD